MLIQQMGKDKQFGLEIMRAAGIRTLGPMKEHGVPLTVLMLFSNGRPVWPVYGCFQAEDGTIMLMWPYKIREPRIYQSTLKKALPIIAKTNHCGMLGIRTVVRPEDQKIYGLEWMTTQSEDLMRVIGKLCKIDLADLDTIARGIMSNPMLLMPSISFTFAGHMADIMQKYNGFLQILRQSGFEIPLSSVTRRFRVSAASPARADGPARSRQS